MKEDETVKEREEIDVTSDKYIPCFSVKDLFEEFNKLDYKREAYKRESYDSYRVKHSRDQMRKFDNRILFIKSVIEYLKENNNKYSEKELKSQNWFNCFNTSSNFQYNHKPYKTLFELVERTAKLENPTVLNVLENEIVTIQEYEKRAEEEIKKQEHHLDNIFDSSDVDQLDFGANSKQKQIIESLNKYAEYIHSPFISRTELKLFKMAIWHRCYKDKIKLNANVGYSLSSDEYRNLYSIGDFMRHGGRNFSQKLFDRVLRKVDDNVIETLESIVKWDPSKYVRVLAKKMVDNYRLGGAFDLGKKLERGKY
ncbi:hypothetical protein HOK51_00025 [Candidatus Woesearchaeota archaeon]|jgi:hypothetical protein|nr:hypothetical protein [Candidatus Woesearchaeota archaeon]MBT6518198.1 hypothetical protein [Candidatus Woesearchaeota archaeon]MBT7368533.1 hypothetical protein [Candidatus Woesearchaeota archaeon]